jgi:subtilisin-like proprotein convertase family protein
MKKITHLTLFFLCVFVPIIGYNQLTVNNAQTATQLAQLLGGPNVTVSNATITGSSLASGSFNGANSNIGMSGGVILSSGDVTTAPGPNDVSNSSNNLGTGGTTQMDGLAGVATQDAITLEFDFDVQSDFIQFQYIFASEEYPEYAPPNNSSFNDVFAFFISGPGIIGEENIALVPGTNNPVAINNINPVTNNQYYIDNTNGATVQYDGWTTVLTAEKQNLTPCNTYTMKLVIADAGDGAYNSSVFLLENSFIQGIVDINTQTVNADNIALEGCIPASFSLSLDVASATDTQVTYQIGGTATNGIDYQLIDTLVTIPAGQLSASIVINSISDGFTEGQESIYLIFQPTLCAPADTAWLFIDDAQPIDFNLDGTDLSCYDNSTGEILVNATGGFPPYTYYVTTDAGNGTLTQYATNPITGLDAGQYSVQVYDTYGCKAEALIIGGLYNAGQTFLPDGSGVSYASPLNIGGFDTGQTLDNMTQLQQVCATMEHSYLGDLQIKIISPNGQEVILKSFNGGGSCDLGEPIATAPVDGQASSTLIDPGVGYEYCWNTTPNYGTMISESNNFTRNYTDTQGNNYTDTYLPAGSYASSDNLDGLLGSVLNGDWTIEVTDQFSLDNGYIFNWNIALVSDLPDTLVTILEPTEISINGFITQANCGGSDGAINLSVTGDYSPYTYVWSNGATTEDISNLAAGTYQVFVSNTNGCTDSMTFNLNNISSLNIASAITEVTCVGGANGAIDVTPSGGTAPYTFAWNTGQTTEDISAVVAGTYTYTLSDDNGCVLNEDIILGSLPQISISLTTSANEFCGQQNGQINVNTTGGSGSYAYAWDNGATTQNISNVQAGTYTLTVTDVNGCSGTNSFTILNDVSNCSAYCYLTVATNQVTNENCGDATGAIDINVVDATQPYNVSWSTGSTSDDISNLTAGTYSVTVTDANQCIATQNIVVGNNSGTLAISTFQINNDNCGNSNGNLDITVIGGTAPYTYSWDNGASTEDLTGLASGIYEVTLTDDVGCTILQSFTVGNNTGTLAETAGTINENCGNGFGIINMTITGGVAPFTYLWSNGATSEDLNGLSSGTYSCVITDNVGCQLQSIDYVIGNSTGTLALNAVNITNEDCGNSLGEIDLVVAGGALPLTYAWSNTAITEDITGLSAGIFNCTITDNNGCQVMTGDKTVFNTANDIDVITASLTDEVCGNSTGAIDVTISGGSTPYTLNWDSGATTEDLNGLVAGDYVLTVLDNNGCSFNYTETVVNNPGTLNITSTTAVDENCGDGSGTIDIDVIGGTMPYTFTWTNGSTNEDLLGLSAGSYSLNLTDAAGCSTSTSATINGEAISILSNTVNDEICGDSNGSINILVDGGTTPYTFAWDNGSTTEDLVGISAGTYTVNITEAGGCTLTDTYTVGNNTNGLAITNSSITNENCGDGTGAIDVTVVGGTAPLTINWSNGQSTEDLTGLNAGDFTINITDNQGCTVTETSTVTNNSSGFVATITSFTDENCGNGTGAIDITVTGGLMPYTYVWDNGATSEDLTGLSAGTYSVTITDGNSCSIVLTQIVGNITGTLAIANVNLQNENCGNSSGYIDLAISGGTAPYTYVWDNGTTTEDLSGISAGTYICTISDNVGCSINYTGTITDAGGGINTVPTITNELCGNGSGVIDVIVSGGISPFTYSWTGSTPSTCCDYTLNMTDQGNSWNGASITVLINGVSIGDFTVPGGGANVETFNVCSGDNVELVWNSGNFDNEVAFDLVDPTGAILYTHVMGIDPIPGTIYTYAGNCPTTANDMTSISNLTTGSYDLLITDAVGCTLTETYTVGNTASPLTFTNVTVTDDNCDQGNGQINVTIDPNTGLNYFIDGVAQGFGPTGMFFGLNTGTYLINGTDANGCTVDSLITVGNQVTFTTTIVNTLDENCGQSDGLIDIDVNGTSSNFTYAWDNGEITQDIANISAGTYICTITDTDNNCEDQITVVIVNSADITATTTLINENCGDAAGSIDITVVGSTTLNYNWSNGQTTEDITGLSAGTYSCIITNTASGCFANVSVDVQNTTTGITATGTVNDEFCGNQDGEIILNVTNGSGNYTYLWSNAETTQDINTLSAGTYTVTVTDVNDGCQSTQTFDVLSDAFFTVDVVSFTNENCGDAQGSIDINVAGGGGPGGNNTFLWSNGETTEDITNLSLGTYTCTVSNAFGCSVNITQVIDNTSDLTVLEGFTNENCNDGSGAIDLTISGSTNTTFIWNTGETTEDLTGLNAGIYTCTITNVTSGCVETVSIEILNITSGINVIGGATNENCGDGSGSINLSTNGGSGNYTYSWSNGATTEDLNGLSEGTYDVTVTDLADGCTYTESFTITNTATFNISGVLTESTCPTCTDGAIDITINETGFPDGTYTFSWSNGETIEDIADLTSGTYTITATSGSGCSVTTTFEILNNNSSVGLIENDLISVSVYPNPAQHNVYVDYDLKANSTVQLKIISFEGKLVYKSQINTTNGTLEINTTDLADGIYFVNLQSESITKTVKLIIAK